MMWPTESAAYAALNLDATLIQLPMLMAHNAATIYMKEASLLTLQNFYGKNQDKGGEDEKNDAVGKFSDLLNCGSRALDLEIFDDSTSPVGFKHDFIEKIDGITLQGGLTDIQSWSDQYPQELVLLSVDCAKTTKMCSDRVLDVFKDSNIEFVTDCDMLKSMTVDQAMKKGPVLAISDACVKQNWDAKLSCHGSMPSNTEEQTKELLDKFLPYQDSPTSFLAEYDEAKAKIDVFPTYSCWEEDPNKDIPHKALFDSLDKVKTDYASSTVMWELQALWQGNDLGIILGMNQPRPLPASIFSLQPSSSKNDVEKSNLNKKVFDYIQKNQPSDFNIVTMDYVCNESGKKIIGALRPTDATKSPTAAPAAAVSNSVTYFSYQHISIFAIVSSLVMSYF